MFYSAVILFLLIGCGLIFFALGYKYDFVQKKFLKTGSIEFKFNSSTEVYINDELAGETSFLGDAFSKGGLLPRTYRIRSEKKDYLPWQKLVKVEAGFLASFPKIVLIPDFFEEKIVASSSISPITIKRFEKEGPLAIIGNKQKTESIDLKTGEVKPIKKGEISESALIGEVEVRYIPSPDKEKTAWFNKREVWIKWEKDASYQPFQRAGDVEFVIRLNQDVEDIQWYEDSSHLFVSTGGILKFIEIDTRGGNNIFDISDIASPFYYSSNMDAIFKFEGNKLIKIDLSN